MRKFHPFPVENIEAFKQQLLTIANHVKHFCYLDSNNYPNYPYSTFGSFFAIDAIDSISVNKNCLYEFEQFQKKHQDWLFGFLNYDLKNEIEPDLQTNNAESFSRDSAKKRIFRAESHVVDSARKIDVMTHCMRQPKIDNIQNPLLHFFVPKYLVKIENEKVEIGIVDTHCMRTSSDNESILNEFKNLIHTKISRYEISNLIPITIGTEISNRISKQDYITTIENIKQDIQFGDIYEMNFCQEFYTENVAIQPTKVFQKLNEISKAPFSCYFKNDTNHLMCASPERFLKRQHNTLISQPIKGTRKRIQDKQQDRNIKQELFFDEKERSENVMIVDLVRNDFSKIAIKNSVEVEELFGIYTFEQVHQMISTITCNIPKNLSFSDIIKATFPMGSMTGAPKIAAMQLIEQYEPTKRGLFSGAVGYITPKGNFDFNVVIRSIFYNEHNKYVSIQTGSAITIDCDAEKEYEECLLKAKAMLEALS
jgi:para-aminobenzoate synthetase component 1